MATSLVVTFYNSSTFQRFFGSNGEVGRIYKLESEWGYRHASMSGRAVETNAPKNSAEEHASYFNFTTGKNHFFGPSDPYK